MAYSRKHLEHPLDYQVLLSLLQELDDLWEPTSLSREEVSVMRYYNTGDLSLMETYITTPGRWQSKTLLTIDEGGSKIARNSFFIAICHQSGDKWHWKTLFLKIFYLSLLIVLTFSIAVYSV